MRKKLTLTLVAAAAVVGTAAGGAAVAAGEAEDERPITGSALERASAAALEHTGGGRVTGTEVGDEESYYEVEVTLENGGQVDVQLDKSFNVVGSEHGQEDAG